jgi:hypothetical protein
MEALRGCNVTLLTVCPLDTSADTEETQHMAPVFDTLEGFQAMMANLEEVMVAAPRARKVRSFSFFLWFLADTMVLHFDWEWPGMSCIIVSVCGVPPLEPQRKQQIPGHAREEPWRIL